MGYATFNLKYRAGNNNSNVPGFLLRASGSFPGQRGYKSFNKPMGLKAARNFLKLVKGFDVKVERKSFSQLVVNYN